MYMPTHSKGAYLGSTGTVGSELWEINYPTNSVYGIPFAIKEATLEAPSGRVVNCTSTSTFEALTIANR